ESAVEHQVRDAFRMLHGIGNGDRAASRDPEQGKAIESRRFHNCFEIVYPRVEAPIIYVALRHAVATLVVADQAMVTGEVRGPVEPDGAAPFEGEIRQPVRCLHERWPIAGGGVGKSDPVTSGAVPDFLPRFCGRRWR